MKVGLFNTEPGGGDAVIAYKRLYQGLQKNNIAARFIYINRKKHWEKLHWYGEITFEKIIVKKEIKDLDNLFVFSTGQYGNSRIEKKMFYNRLL